jgi:hypothetical protein
VLQIRARHDGLRCCGCPIYEPGVRARSALRRRRPRCGFCPLTPPTWSCSLRHRYGVWEEVYRSLAGGRRRRAPGAGGSDAGIEGAGGRRYSSMSTWSTGSSGAAAQKSSGYSPADVPQRICSRCQRRDPLEVHKAVHLRGSFLGQGFVVSGLLQQRLRPLRFKETSDGVSLQGTPKTSL